MSLKLHILPTLKLIFVQAVLNTVVYQLLIVYTNVLVSSAVLRVYIARYKHDKGWGNLRQLCKPKTKSRVCITVKNFPSPTSVYIRICKQRKKTFSLAFMK